MRLKNDVAAAVLLAFYYAFLLATIFWVIVYAARTRASQLERDKQRLALETAAEATNTVCLEEVYRDHRYTVDVIVDEVLNGKVVEQNCKIFIPDNHQVISITDVKTGKSYAYDLSELEDANHELPQEPLKTPVK